MPKPSKPPVSGPTSTEAQPASSKHGNRRHGQPQGQQAAASQGPPVAKPRPASAALHASSKGADSGRRDGARHTVSTWQATTTEGFNTPDKQKSVHESAKQEVYSFMRAGGRSGGSSGGGSQKGRYDKEVHPAATTRNPTGTLRAGKPPSSSPLPGVPAAPQHDGVADAAPHVDQSLEQPWDVDQLAVGRPAADSDTAPVLALPAAPPALPAQQGSAGPAAPALSAAQKEALLRDVAARIIQAYWRSWRAWRAKLRRDAEEATLRRLLSSSLQDCLPGLVPGPAAGAVQQQQPASALPEQQHQHQQQQQQQQQPGLHVEVSFTSDPPTGSPLAEEVGPVRRLLARLARSGGGAPAGGGSDLGASAPLVGPDVLQMGSHDLQLLLRAMETSEELQRQEEGEEEGRSMGHTGEEERGDEEGGGEVCLRREGPGPRAAAGGPAGLGLRASSGKLGVARQSSLGLLPVAGSPSRFVEEEEEVQESQQEDVGRSELTAERSHGSAGGDGQAAQMGQPSAQQDSSDGAVQRLRQRSMAQRRSTARLEVQQQHYGSQAEGGGRSGLDCGGSMARPRTASSAMGVFRGTAEGADAARCASARTVAETVGPARGTAAGDRCLSMSVASTRPTAAHPQPPLKSILMGSNSSSSSAQTQFRTQTAASATQSVQPPLKSILRRPSAPRSEAEPEAALAGEGAATAAQAATALRPLKSILKRPSGSQQAEAVAAGAEQQAAQQLLPQQQGKPRGPASDPETGASQQEVLGHRQSGGSGSGADDRAGSVGAIDPDREGPSRRAPAQQPCEVLVPMPAPHSAGRAPGGADAGCGSSGSANPNGALHPLPSAAAAPAPPPAASYPNTSSSGRAQPTVPSAAASVALPAPDSSLTTDKLRSILSFLDTVEQQAVEEAASLPSTCAPGPEPSFWSPPPQQHNDARSAGSTQPAEPLHTSSSGRQQKQQQQVREAAYTMAAAPAEPALAADGVLGGIHFKQTPVQDQGLGSREGAPVTMGTSWRGTTEPGIRGPPSDAAAPLVPVRAISARTDGRERASQAAGTSLRSEQTSASGHWPVDAAPAFHGRPATASSSSASLSVSRTVAPVPFAHPSPSGPASSASEATSSLPVHQPPSPSLSVPPTRHPLAFLAESSSDGAQSSQTLPPAPAGPAPAFLAESVYDGVRSKLRRLHNEVRDRDVAIAALHQELEMLQHHHRTQLAEAEARLQRTLAAQRAEHEAGLERHLGFIDRLLADKDELAHKCQQLAEVVQGMESKHSYAIAKLKEGWASELRRQREGWAAAEKAKREQWMEAKTKAVKEMTVQGLETEVQQLLTRHKAELQAAQQAAAQEVARKLEVATAEHQVAVKQLRDRLLKEQEDAVERERVSAQGRLREASERYEAQLQTQRMRLVSDTDLRMEQLETSRREERKRWEDSQARAAAEAEAREKRQAEDWRQEKESLRRTYDKQVESLREQYETGQEGWRAAMAERARKEVAEREAALRDRLTRERDEEIEAVVQRLEAEGAASLREAQTEWSRREEALNKKLAAAAQEAKKQEARLSERFRQAGTALQEEEARRKAAEQAVGQLQRELAARQEAMQAMEEQLCEAREVAVAQERDQSSQHSQREQAQQQALQEAERRCALLESQLQAAGRQAALEMAHVEGRVKATLAKRDEAAAALREQVAALTQQLKATQEVLAAQQRELGSL